MPSRVYDVKCCDDVTWATRQQQLPRPQPRWRSYRGASYPRRSERSPTRAPGRGDRGTTYTCRGRLVSPRRCRKRWASTTWTPSEGNIRSNRQVTVDGPPPFWLVNHVTSLAGGSRSVCHSKEKPQTFSTVTTATVISCVIMFGR